MPDALAALRRVSGLRHVLWRCTFWLAATGVCMAQGRPILKVGHWVEIKGTYELGQFFADSVEVLEPEDEESLIGTVESVSEDGTSFVLMGQQISVSDRTRWRKVSPEDLAGKRVKVEGHYRGPRKFSARTISERSPGRERISGRVDDRRRVDFVSELRVMNFTVTLPRNVPVESERDLSAYTLAPARQVGADARPSVRTRDDDDNIPATVLLADNLRLGVTLDYQIRHEENYNINERDEEDRTDKRLGGRGELTWLPTDDFYALFGFSYQKLLRSDEDDGRSQPDDFQLREAYGYVRDVGVEGLDLQLGRQDFDERREWLYDQVLDAARLHLDQGSWALELSASTLLADGSPRDEASDNLIAYLSNNDDDRHLAAYVLDRRDPRGVRDYPIHFGLRALGEWLPDHEMWLEASLLRGYTGNTDLTGFGFDVGTTWSPESLDPLYFNAGYAYGSGDANLADGEDGNFRQSGLQDNTDKLGGVTSLKYYGELVDPELSNLGIVTLGIGTRIGKRNSLDLIYHRYRQVEATGSLLDTEIDRRPTGLDPDLGWEVDLVFGSRAHEKFNVEVVLAAFEPGSAFTRQDTAYLVKVQVRVKL